jgi:nucleoside-diphosphate-sugar epimerase
MSTQRIAVTGAGGYIGSRMVERLLAKGIPVVALDRFFFGDVLADLRSDSKLTVVKDDIRTCAPSIFKNVDVVIHLAALSNDPSADLNPSLTESINYEGTMHVAKIAKEQGVNRFIFSSSCSVYGASPNLLTEESPLAPVSAYARSKIMAEEQLLNLSSPEFVVTSLRNATVYGVSRRRMRFDLVLNLMTLHAMRNSRIFIMGGGQQWRPLVHIDDVIDAFLLVASHPEIPVIEGQIFNVGSNKQNTTVSALAHKFKAVFPEVLLEVVPDDPDRRDYRVCFDKVTRRLGYNARRTLDDGIAEVRHDLDAGEISDSPKTITVKYYKYLLEADNILRFVKLGDKLLE